jgi:AcrR family transcriptional regulator
MGKTKTDSNTEQLIIAAARKVFVRDGMAGARMQDIADEAGINKALLHYYFRSKNQLFETIFQQTALQFIPRVNEIFDCDEPLFKKIEMFCSEYVQRLVDNPFIPLFIINEVNRQPEDFIKKMWGGSKPNVKKFAEQIEKETKKGTIKKIHPLQLLMNMISLCIFPVLARPMIIGLTGISAKQMNELMEQRKTEVSKFIIDSIKK